MQGKFLHGVNNSMEWPSTECRNWQRTAVLLVSYSTRFVTKTRSNFPTNQVQNWNQSPLPSSSRWLHMMSPYHWYLCLLYFRLCHSKSKRVKKNSNCNKRGPLISSLIYKPTRYNPICIKGKQTYERCDSGIGAQQIRTRAEHGTSLMK